jgi:hypothetical protein
MSGRRLQSANVALLTEIRPTLWRRESSAADEPAAMLDPRAFGERLAL